VAGREEGVGMELVVATVLRLPPDKRDCGRRRPVCIVLCASGFALFVPSVGETAADVDAAGRNEVAPKGLEARRLSSFGGDGESSMIRTQPEDSLFLFFSESLSLLRLCVSTLRLVRLSQLDLAPAPLLEGPAPFPIVDIASAFALR